jgi:hypothetical protein
MKMLSVFMGMASSEKNVPVGALHDRLRIFSPIKIDFLSLICYTAVSYEVVACIIKRHQNCIINSK